MTQGTVSALSFLTDMVEAVTPKTDPHHGFVSVGGGRGSTQPLENRYNSNRYFYFNINSFSSDDGAAGLSGRKRISVVLRVRYDIPQDPNDLQRMMNEDAANLIDTLKGPNYDLATTGILSLIPSLPTVETLFDSNNEQIAQLLLLPFDLLYLEA